MSLATARRFHIYFYFIIYHNNMMLPVGTGQAEEREKHIRSFSYCDFLLSKPLYRIKTLAYAHTYIHQWFKHTRKVFSLRFFFFFFSLSLFDSLSFWLSSQRRGVATRNKKKFLHGKLLLPFAEKLLFLDPAKLRQMREPSRKNTKRAFSLILQSYFILNVYERVFERTCWCFDKNSRK